VDAIKLIAKFIPNEVNYAMAVITAQRQICW